MDLNYHTGRSHPRLFSVSVLVTFFALSFHILLSAHGADHVTAIATPGGPLRGAQPFHGAGGVQDEARTSFTRRGDFILGGLFDIHSEQDGECQEISPRGLQWMYAMVYAIELINVRQDLLPNVTLGFQIKDTCGNPNVAVRSSLDFITSSTSPGACLNNSESVSEEGRPTNLVAVVGPATSNAAVSVASLFQLFKLPEIIYSATSELLSESRYSYFTRVVPGDNHQAAALADIVHHFGWPVVATIYSDDLAYGLNGQKRFLDFAARKGICVSYEGKIGSSSTAEDFREIVNDLRGFPKVKAIVAFANESPMLRLLEVFAEQNATGYTWIGTDGWTASPALTADDRLTRVTQGMLGLRYSTTEVDGFLEFLRGLSPLVDTGYEDPFLMEYWERALECHLLEIPQHLRDFARFRKICNMNETLPESDAFFAGRFVSTILDAVEVVAMALHVALNCDEGGCKTSKYLDSDEILALMKNVSFVGTSGYRIEFSDGGNLESGAFYDVYNLKPVTTCASQRIVEEIGLWNQKEGLTVGGNISWYSDDSCSRGAIPSSICSASCRPGQRQLPKGLSECCWVCVACQGNLYSDREDALTCSNCSSEMIVNADRTGCDKLPDHYFTPSSSLGIALITLSVPGILLTVIMGAIFRRRRHAQVVVRACAGHSYAILFCALVCFAFSWLPFLRADDVVCAVKACLQLLPVTLLQGMLFLTAYVTKKGRRFVTNWTRFLLGAGTCALFCVFVAIWFAVDLPRPSRIPDTAARFVYVDCQDGEIFALTLSFMYSLMLDVAGLCLAYRARNKEENFREGKFVFFAFIVHIMIWLTTLGIYLAVGSGKHLQAFILAIGGTFSGYIPLFMLFVPKLYLMRTKPYANEKMDARAKRKIKGPRSLQKKIRKSRLSSEVLSARRALLSNCRRALDSIMGERTQSIRSVKFFLQRMEELKSRHQKILEAKKSLLSDVKRRKIHLVISSPKLPSTSL
ncbi:metabotropic glutamate receptor 8-like [Acanthaster planci]|uniref:Metabotropic glutamate receptor 8-like n=1 Tax=Acanthaster planci TaxID=133434 RepID=A0A8B7YNG4_ACAPL|nr:metabotropic glutamate receptor 8-like [Acanthaster planci]